MGIATQNEDRGSTPQNGDHAAKRGEPILGDAARIDRRGFAGLLCGMACVIGIDPGVSGAIVKLTGTLSAPVLQWCHDLPAYAEKTGSGKTRRYIDGPALLKILKPEKPDLIICERMIAPPGVASNTAFSMGATMGALQTVFALHGARARLVVSSVWKRALDCPADKESARLMAGRLLGFEHWPFKRDHNRAEAALIALYGISAFGQKPINHAIAGEGEGE